METWKVTNGIGVVTSWYGPHAEADVTDCVRYVIERSYADDDLSITVGEALAIAHHIVHDTQRGETRRIVSNLPHTLSVDW